MSEWHQQQDNEEYRQWADSLLDNDPEYIDWVNEFYEYQEMKNDEYESVRSK